MSFLQKAIETVSKAVEEDRVKNYQEALRLYHLGVMYFHDGIKSERLSDRTKKSIGAKCNEYLNRADDLKKYLSGGISPPAQAKPAQTCGCGVSEKPSVFWNDVAGLESAKETLKESVIQLTKFPHQFKGKGTPWLSILLYGPPGTGKSYLAQALATEANNFTFLGVSSSDLVCNWLGESQKLVKNLFERSGENKPSIIFIDEIDLLCSDSVGAKRIRTEFLQQMQGLGGNNSGLLILAATDRPWVLDDAVRRVFEKRIYIPLPDASARCNIFKQAIGNTPNLLSERDFQDLVSHTQGFSGADISAVVRNAFMMPVRKVQNATHFKRISGPSRRDPTKIVHDLLTPCSPSESGAVEMSWMDLDGDRLQEPVMDINDMINSLNSTKPTVDDEHLHQMNQFTKDFGQHG